MGVRVLKPQIHEFPRPCGCAAFVIRRKMLDDVKSHEGVCPETLTRRATFDVDNVDLKTIDSTFKSLRLRSDRQ